MDIKKIKDRFYDLNDATEVVYSIIPQYLRDKYEYKDIYFILEVEYNYLDSIGIMIGEDEEHPICDYPVDIDQEKMEILIVTTAIKNDILLSYEELEDIMEAELIYYKMNDALGDMSSYLN